MHQLSYLIDHTVTSQRSILIQLVQSSWDLRLSRLIVLTDPYITNMFSETEQVSASQALQDVYWYVPYTNFFPDCAEIVVEIHGHLHHSGFLTPMGFINIKKWSHSFCSYSNHHNNFARVQHSSFVVENSLMKFETKLWRENKIGTLSPSTVYIHTQCGKE